MSAATLVGMTLARHTITATFTALVCAAATPTHASPASAASTLYADAAAWITVPIVVGAIETRQKDVLVSDVDEFAVTAVPVRGVITSRFGHRRDPITRARRMHRGVDFAAPRGTEVYAAAPGIVAQARRLGGYGLVVIIDHGSGMQTRYAHLRKANVRRGDVVDPDTLIGAVGTTGRSTGPHLHFELWRNGRAVDPLAWLAPRVRFLLKLQTWFLRR
jgi:murein DD-endopeptidase MepM/ murein hydrolase activator NlpD